MVLISVQDTFCTWERLSKKGVTGQTQAVVPKQTHVAKERVTVTEMKNAKDTLSQRAQTVRYAGFFDAFP